MYLPHPDDELTTWCRILENQLDALRAASLGLTDEQARRRPLRSVLSITGILKHATHCMRGSLVAAHRIAPDPADDDFYGSFAPTDQESLQSVLQDFDRVRQQYLAMCWDGDLDAVVPAGPMPWYGVDQPRPAHLRYLYAHHVEEFARHAGHADIIREQLDGAKGAELVAAVEGRPANAFVTPWAPLP